MARRTAQLVTTETNHHFGDWLIRYKSFTRIYSRLLLLFGEDDPTEYNVNCVVLIERGCFRAEKQLNFTVRMKRMQNKNTPIRGVDRPVKSYSISYSFYRYIIAKFRVRNEIHAAAQP